MEFLNKYFKYDNNLEISGLTFELNIFYMLYLFKNCNKNILVVTSSLYEANKVYNSLSTYTDNNLLFPMDDFLSSMIVAASPELKYTRLETLDKLKSGKHIIVTNLMGYLKHLPSKNNEKASVIKKSDDYKREALLSLLENLGYHRDSIVTSTGEYAVRGFIVDVFLMNEKKPIRFEFDGNKIDSIRYFNEETQISENEVKSIELKAVEEIDEGVYNSLYDYIDDAIVVYVDKTQIDASYKKLVEDIFEYQKNQDNNKKIMYDFDDIKPKNQAFINTFEKKNKGLIFDSKEILNYNANFEKLIGDYQGWKKLKKEVIFYLSKDSQVKRIKKLIPDAIIKKEKINKGFMFDKYIVIGENDIEQVSHEPIKYKRNFYVGKRIRD